MSSEESNFLKLKKFIKKDCVRDRELCTKLVLQIGIFSKRISLREVLCVELLAAGTTLWNCLGFEVQTSRPVAFRAKFQNNSVKIQ